MDIIKIVAVGLITCVCSILVKQTKPEISIFVTLSGCIVIIVLVLQSLTSVFDSFKTILDKTGIDDGIFACVLKIIGVGYLVEFASSICVDAGNTAIADKLLLAGKVLILVMCLPIITNLLDIILGLMP